jgi:hypothetical protein
MDDGARLPAPATWWRVRLKRRCQFATKKEKLEANLAVLILTDAQIAKLSEASKPALNFPADINTHLAPMFGFPGTTIDGKTAPASPLLSASANRYRATRCPLGSHFRKWHQTDMRAWADDLCWSG